jgi:hypothetical protein
MYQYTFSTLLCRNHHAFLLHKDHDVKVIVASEVEALSLNMTLAAKKKRVVVCECHFEFYLARHRSGHRALCWKRPA